MHVSELDFNNPDAIISFFEKNQINYSNLDSKTSSQLEEALNMNLHYINSLYTKCHYKQCLKQIDRVKSELELNHQDLNFLNKKKEHLSNIEGMTLSNVKKYREAHEIFKELLKSDPDHHYYQLWYTHTKLMIWNWVFSVFQITGVALIILDILFSFQETRMNTIGIILILITLSAQYFLKRYSKNKIN